MAAMNAQELGREVEDLIKTPASDALFLSEQERRILEMWDKEEEMRLEINLLKAQRDSHHDDYSSMSDEKLTTELAQAEKDLLQARSKNTIRQNIINQVLITDPILKALHADPATTTTLEQRLPPLVQERDILAMVQNLLAKKLQKTRLDIAKLEQRNIDALAANKAAAKRMLEMAKDVKAEKIEEVRDARTRAQLEKLEAEAVRSRKEWRVWKSVVGGVIVGSGVDWASDPKLHEVVMDEEDEMT